jgi:hypothetical protein
MRLFLMTATVAGFALTTAMMAEQALAVQDTPTTVNGVEMVCTGVGSAKDDPRWKAYPIKIVLATTGGANLANAHVQPDRRRQQRPCQLHHQRQWRAKRSYAAVPSHRTGRAIAAALGIKIKRAGGVIHRLFLIQNIETVLRRP